MTFALVTIVGTLLCLAVVLTNRADGQSAAGDGHGHGHGGHH
jgi:hypothetical protein